MRLGQMQTAFNMIDCVCVCVCVKLQNRDGRMRVQGLIENSCKSEEGFGP